MAVRGCTVSYTVEIRYSYGKEPEVWVTQTEFEAKAIYLEQLEKRRSMLTFHQISIRDDEGQYLALRRHG